MKLLITGSLGHIGSGLIRELPLNTLEQVVMVDDLSTQRYCSLFHLNNPGNLVFRQMDVVSSDMTSQVGWADVVVHLAGRTNAENSDQNFLDSNLFATIKLAKLCAEYGTKFIFPSTTSVYGVSEEVVDEQSELNPQSKYAESKMQAEQQIRQIDGLNYVIFRFGTIVGPSPGMRFHTAVNKFCWQACLGQPLTVWETAYFQKRPYLHLLDAIKAIRIAILYDTFDRDLFNVVTENLSVSEVITMIQNWVPVQIRFTESPIMNQFSYEVSTDKIVGKRFAFDGFISEGIKATIDQIGRWYA